MVLYMNVLLLHFLCVFWFLLCVFSHVETMIMIMVSLLTSSDCVSRSRDISLWCAVSCRVGWGSPRREARPKVSLAVCDLPHILQDWQEHLGLLTYVNVADLRLVCGLD